MPSFARTILDYWRNAFEAGTVVESSGPLLISVNPALGRARRLMILTGENGSTKIVLDGALAEQLGVRRGSGISAPALRRRLADNGIMLHDPDFLFYFPADSASIPLSSLRYVVRRLTETDRETFDAFRAQATDQDLEDAYVELDHWAAFGSFYDVRLVSAASMYRWDGAAIADLGVLTLPEARGRGHARAVVQAISRSARENGLEPQYRCQTGNLASAALARSAGLLLFAKWEVIRSDNSD